VCLYQKVDTGELCAVKFDPNDSGDSDVLKECNFFRAHHKNEALTCIPKYYEHGKQDGRRYLIIELLEQSLEEHVNERVAKGENIYSVVAEVAPKMLEALRQVHSTGHIHRDVKPDNYRVHKGKLYITDFGTLKKVTDDNGNLIVVYEDDPSFAGTFAFVSVNTHYRKTQSFRDDLEGLGYAILNLLVGDQVPWFELQT
jgi:serine/threonine protein kinase